MTLERFVSTKRWSDNLSADAPDYYTYTDDETADRVPHPRGWIYCGYLVIEAVLPHWPEASRKRGRWYLILGNEDWITDDLSKLEALLHDYAVSEGVVISAEGGR